MNQKGNKVRLKNTLIIRSQICHSEIRRRTTEKNKEIKKKKNLYRRIRKTASTASLRLGPEQKKPEPQLSWKPEPGRERIVKIGT